MGSVFCFNWARSLKRWFPIIVVLLAMTFVPSVIVAATASTVGPDQKVLNLNPNAVEMAEKRTQNSKTFDNLDGSYTVVIGEDFHYEATKGHWKEIDTRLEKASSKKLNGQAYDLSITKAPFHAYFGKNSNAPQLFEIPGKGQILIQPIGANPSLGVVDENKITYPDVWKEVDWVRTILSDGVKSDMVLHNANAQNEFRFKVQAPNLDYEQQLNGLILWKKGEEVVARIQPATVMDAAGKQGVAYQRIEKTANGLELVMGADPDWLAASERVWPVTVDPTVTIIANPFYENDAYVSEAQPDVKFWNTQLIYFGKYATNDRRRAYMRFDLSSFDQQYPNKAIISANISVVSDRGGINAKLHKVTSYWSEANITWNAQPSYNKTAILTQTTSSPNIRQNWDITELFTNWYTGKTGNNGVMWEGDALSAGIYGRWLSSNNSNSQIRPSLIITYTNPPVATPISPLGTSSSYPYISSTSNITWAYSDPDGDVQASYQIVIKESGVFGDVVVIDTGEVASQTTSYDIPSSVLEAPTLYFYQIRVKDSMGGWSEYTTPQYFRFMDSPSNLSLTPGQTTVAAAWSGNGNIPLFTTYQLWRGTTKIYQGIGLSYTDTGLTSNTTYQYSVNALCTDGTATNSVTGSVTTNIIKTNPVATIRSPLGTASVPAKISTSTPTISWTFFDADDDDQSSYQIIITRESDNAIVKDTGAVSSASKSFTVPADTLALNTKYYCQVKVKDSSGAWSEYTTPQYFILLATPSDLVLTPGETTVNIAWSSNGNPSGTIYRLWRGGTKIYQGTELSYADSGLTPSTTYQYSVSALFSDGSFTESILGSVTTISSIRNIFYNYDSNNRLDSINLPSGIIDFQYDANGNLIQIIK